MTDNVLEVTVHIEAQPETVFSYFTDPAKYVQWMGSTARIVPEPGGEYWVHMRDGVEAAGKVVEIDPPKRVVFTWGWVADSAVPPGSSQIEVTFQSDKHGTLVTLRQHGLPSAEQSDHHQRGWELYLSRLALCAAGREPGPDPNAGSRAY